MARARSLKPGFFKNERLAELDPLARILFAGLWTLADRAGRLEDRPKRIRAEILPYDDGNVDELIQCLHGAGFVLRYSIDNNKFIQILNFSKHQNPHIKEAVSTIPAPCEFGTSPADSLNPITLTLNPSKALSERTPPKKVNGTHRGTRLPPDWELSEEMGQWAEKEMNLTPQQVLAIADRFKDYWISAPKGTKLDWNATWRNWIRSNKA